MIPTAEEFRKQNTTTAFINSNKEAEYCMIEFAKLHVTAALKEASENAHTIKVDTNIGDYEEVSRKSILTSYPLTLIR